MNKKDFKKKYHSYLKSEDWQKIRQSLFKERGKVCERCDKDLNSKIAEIHHITYENIFNENLEDLKILCHDCYRKVHNLDRAFKYISSESQEEGFFINQYKKPFLKKKVSKKRKKRNFKHMNKRDQRLFIEEKERKERNREKSKFLD